MSIKKIKSAVQYHIVKSFMCPKCFSIESIQADLYYEHNGDTKLLDVNFEVMCHKCETTEGKTKMVEIDPTIVVPISHINKAGFETDWSCEGHYRDFDTMPNDEIATLPYVAFDFNCDQLDKKQELLDRLNKILEENPMFKYYITIKEIKIPLLDSEIPEDEDIDKCTIWHVIAYGTWYDIDGNSVLERFNDDGYEPKITYENYIHGKEMFVKFLYELCSQE